MKTERNSDLNAGGLTIWTVATKDYELFVPMFVFSALRSNRGADVVIGVEDCVSFCETHAHWISFVQKQLQGTLTVVDRDFRHQLPGAVRFLRYPHTNNPYIYFCDVDFFIYESILEQNLGALDSLGLPFNNVVRPGTKRLTGLHFTKTNGLWPSLSNATTPDSWSQKNDEEILYELVAPTLDSGTLESRLGLGSRPLPGVHLSLFSRFPAKYQDEISGLDIPGWSIADNDDGNRLREAVADPVFLEFKALLNGEFELIGNIVTAFASFLTASSRHPTLFAFAPMFSGLSRQLSNRRAGLQQTLALANSTKTKLEEEKTQLLNLLRESAGQLLSVRKVLKRRPFRALIAVISHIDSMLGREKSSPQQKLSFLAALQLTAAPASQDGEESLASHRKRPSSEKSETLAVQKTALKLMTVGDWDLATKKWSKAESLGIEGERRQLLTAGFTVSSWLANPRGFAEELRRNQAVAAGNSQKEGCTVYSSIIGHHDPSWPVIHGIPGASHSRVTDNPSLATWGQWRNRPVEFRGGTPARSARWAKTHPHWLFPEHRWVVWMDGNLVLVGDVEGLFERFKLSGLPMAAIPHPVRNDVDEELEACVRRSKDDSTTLQLARKRLGPDPGVGLWETGFCFFDTEHPKFRMLVSIWWSLIESGTHRDQITLPYAVSQAGVEIHAILPRGESVRSDKRFALIPHNHAAFRLAHRQLVASIGQFGAHSEPESLPGA